MQSGRNPELDGEWAGKGDKTSFKSNLFITTPEGMKIPMDRVEDKMPTWDSIPAGCTLSYEVKTGCVEDRVNLKLTYFDLNRFLEVYNAKMDALTEAELQKLEDGDETLLEDISATTIESIGIENLYVGIWSDVITTDSDGIAKGDILLNENWPMTSYLFNAHYGYQAELESSNSSKSWIVAWDIITIAGLIVGSFVPGLNVVLWGAFAVEMAIIGAGLIASGMGAAGENRCGDYFPTAGFNQIYVFNIESEEAIAARNALISDENQSILSKMNIIVKTKGIAKVAGIGAGIILLFSLLKGRR
jgi:hypothetical protein